MKLQEQGFIFINDIIKQKTYNESNYFSSPDDYSKISLDFNINENFIDSSFNEEINNNNLITESKTTSYINKDNPYQEKLFEQEVCERCISLEKELIGKNNKIEKLTELYNQPMDDYNKLNSKYKELIKKVNNDLGSEIQEKNTKTIENSNIKENNEFQNDHINTIQNIESINGNDKNIQQKKRKMKNNKKENKLGRKTKRESKVEDKCKKENTHDHFSDDNMRKNVKILLLNI